MLCWADSTADINTLKDDVLNLYLTSNAPNNELLAVVGSSPTKRSENAFWEALNDWIDLSVSSNGTQTSSRVHTSPHLRTHTHTHSVSLTLSLTHTHTSSLPLVIRLMYCIKIFLSWLYNFVLSLEVCVCKTIAHNFLFDPAAQKQS